MSSCLSFYIYLSSCLSFYIFIYLSTCLYVADNLYIVVTGVFCYVCGYAHSSDARLIDCLSICYSYFYLAIYQSIFASCKIATRFLSVPTPIHNYIWRISQHMSHSIHNYICDISSMSHSRTNGTTLCILIRSS